MVNVIICDDNDKDRANVLEIVDSFMNKNKIEYKMHVYNDYNKKFYDVIDSKIPFKIYLLDINPKMVESWKKHFTDLTDVEIVCEDFSDFMKNDTFRIFRLQT